MLASNDRRVLDEKSDITHHTFRGTDVFQSAIETLNKNSKVLVYFDPDVDGLVAGLLMCRLLSQYDIPYEWYINSNRGHDFSLPIDETLKGWTVFAVDFLIDYETVVKLVDNGTNLVSIDHHVTSQDFIEYRSGNCFGIVINNQYPFEDETGRYLSGAGVVYESIIVWNKTFETRENRALVGWTLLSDIRDIENPSAKGYLHDLYNHPYQGYIKYLIEASMGEKDYGFGVPRIDRNYADFKLSPIINSCLRFNQQDMVVNFFLGKGYVDSSFRDLQKQLTKVIAGKLMVHDFEHLRVCCFLEEDFPEFQEYLSNFVGLIASQNLDGKRSVICFLATEQGTVKRASFRGRINGLPYQKALEGVLESKGHESAFGISNLRQTKSVLSQIDTICGELEGSSNTERNCEATANLAIYSPQRGKILAIHNSYCLTQNRKYVRYTGDGVKVKRSGKNYTEYLLDGISVLCFSTDITPQSGYIFPILERGYVSYYLESGD